MDYMRMLGNRDVVNVEIATLRRESNNFGILKVILANFLTQFSSRYARFIIESHVYICT